jgi:ribonuclease HI
MIYRVYTDAATKLQEGYSSVAFLVLQGNMYLKSFNERKEVANTSVAESIAVSLALEYIVDELSITEDDEVIIFCDSLYTVKFARKCLKSFKNDNKNDNFCLKPTNAFWLLGIYENIPKVKGKLTFSKIKAHPKGKNPHCYVDRLAKSGLFNH